MLQYLILGVCLLLVGALLYVAAHPACPGCGKRKWNDLGDDYWSCRSCGVVVNWGACQWRFRGEQRWRDLW